MPACAALYQRVARDAFPWREPAELSAADFLAAAGEGEEVFAAVEHGQVVGVLSLWPPNFVHSLYVDVAHQGRGVGYRLLGAAARRAAAPLLLKCQTLNHAARRFYARHGFVEAGGGEDGGFGWVFLQQDARPNDPPGIALASPLHPQSVALITALDDLMNRLYPPQCNHLPAPAELAGPDVQFLVARRSGEAVGCIALRSDDGWGEVKRLYVDPRARRQGLGRRLMRALEGQARALGLETLRLETGGDQPEALALYRAEGFTPANPFGLYQANGVSLFFEKALPGLAKARCNDLNR